MTYWEHGGGSAHLLTFSIKLTRKDLYCRTLSAQKPPVTTSSCQGSKTGVPCKGMINEEMKSEENDGGGSAHLQLLHEH